MPFSSLSDPVDTARAMAAWEAAWAKVKNEQILMLGSEEAEQKRLAFIVASLAPLALDEQDLVARAILHFRGEDLHRVYGSSRGPSSEPPTPE